MMYILNYFTQPSVVTMYFLINEFNKVLACFVHIITEFICRILVELTTMYSQSE